MKRNKDRKGSGEGRKQEKGSKRKEGGRRRNGRERKKKKFIGKKRGKGRRDFYLESENVLYFIYSNYSVYFYHLFLYLNFHFILFYYVIFLGLAMSASKSKLLSLAEFPTGILYHHDLGKNEVNVHVHVLYISVCHYYVSQYHSIMFSIIVSCLVSQYHIQYHSIILVSQYKSD